MKLRNIAVFFLLAVLAMCACYPIFSLAYLNDEWLQLGYVRGVGLFAGFSDKLTILDMLVGRGRLLGGMINNLFFHYFDDNPAPFILFALLFHLINSYLVYLLTKELTGKKLLAFITACVFSVPAAAHQAVSWLAASVQTVGGMTFVLLAILASIRGVKAKRLFSRLLPWVLAYIAFLFKESTFFVFPLILIAPYVAGARVHPAKVKLLFLWFIPFVLLGFLKIFQLFGQDAVSALGRVILNMVMYPLISLSQFFIPFRFMLRFSVSFAGYFYSFLAGAGESNRAASVVVADLLAVICSFLFILGIAYLYAKRKPFRKTLLFALVWYVLSFVPMAVFLPERNTSYLESRYLYFSFFPISLIAGIFILEIQRIIAGVTRNMKAAWGIAMVLFSLFMYKQITLLQREIRWNGTDAKEIQHAMRAITSLYPSLPDRPVFLVEGDKTFYYAKIYLPFQEGAGYMLGLTFRDYPVIPKELLGESFLAKHESEGYRAIGEKGYGFFGSKESLLVYLRLHPEISPDQIVSMYYYGFEGRLVDTTASVREYILINR